MSTKSSNKTTILFAGDLCLRSRDKFNSVFDDSVTDLLNSGDACFINYESPITGFRKSYVRYTPKIKRDINCSEPDTLADFPSKFPNGVISLANDHLGDRGSVGIIDTLESLEKQGVPFIGAGRFPDEELRYMIIGDDVKVGVIAILGRVRGIKKFRNKVGPLRGRRRQEDVANMIREVREKVDYLVLIYHCGTRYNHVAEPEKRSEISEYLKAGCDAVVTHHPHVIQKPEIINGKYVFYSIGDLYHDQRANVTGEPYEGCILRLEFSDAGIEPALYRLDIQDDSVSVSADPFDPGYITSASEYKSCWAGASDEDEKHAEQYRIYNNQWKLDAYKNEQESIERTLELIEKNRDAAKLEGIENRLHDIYDILGRKTDYIHNKHSDFVDIDAEEEDEDQADKDAAKGIL